MLASGGQLLLACAAQCRTWTTVVPGALYAGTDTRTAPPYADGRNVGSGTQGSSSSSWRLWYVVTIRLHRRQLHRLQCAGGGVRYPYGGTRAFGFKRGTLVRHPRYGLASVGGWDRRKGTLSLHDYRTNKRLTQKAKGTTLVTLTWTPYRTYLVSEVPPKMGLKPDRAKGAIGAPPYRASAGGSPCLKASSL
jgi:hypothetical protein